MEEYVRKEDFKKAFEELEENDKKELKEIGKALDEYWGKPNILIEDKKLKKRIAKICLKLIEQTPNDKTSIMETSYIIAGYFAWCRYGDELDDVTIIAGDLEIPEEYVSEKSVDAWWKEMKEILEIYLKNMGRK